MGLAAPQVGVNVRLMVFNEAGERGHGDEIVLVNPQIVSASRSTKVFEEGCLSFPNLYADVWVSAGPGWAGLAACMRVWRVPDRLVRGAVRCCAVESHIHLMPACAAPVTLTSPAHHPRPGSAPRESRSGRRT